ncbi:hypothetical protein PACILC2_12210 [Paenibacillus cisolokensis]|jgi:TRAP-type C4-dicarboxylate transport system, small permease component|uniref:Tripartite ATP-independent periplasmic transporters DctQ component domain-containing protein n=1 Tax=Paenibacillus cisolokensis TaxID=1658519 RepID=A0ABQ4N367_9BACL|nr:TRAP transporter small permease [Paenibacillus cisolokensis]GIQ62653.1 hypothetical protein PACILC2_12210 [Paenibacillus cisolokensis]
MKRFLNNLDDYLGVAALSGIVLLISANVFCRFVLNRPILWAEEISLALFVWLTFIGISSGVKHNTHVGVDYFIRKMPQRMQYGFQLFRLLVVFGTTVVVLVYWGAQYTIHGVAKVTSVLGLSYTFIIIAVPIGSLLAVYHIVRVLVRRDRDYIMQKRGME